MYNALHDLSLYNTSDTALLILKQSMQCSPSTASPLFNLINFITFVIT